MKNIIKTLRFKTAPNITLNRLIAASQQSQKFVARLGFSKLMLLDSAILSFLTDKNNDLNI